MRPDANDSMSPSLLPESACRSRPIRFKRLGFFHFVKNLHDPLGELGLALDEYRPEELHEALIVLPEAFNLIGDYHAAALKDAIDHEEFCGRLRRLCTSRPSSNGEVMDTRKITFIVGVLGSHKGTCRNSAYWVSGEKEVLLCHKMGNDAPKYFESHPLVGADIDNPHEGVAALICMDAFDTGQPNDQAANVRRSDLLSRDTWLVCSPQRNTSFVRHVIPDAAGRWRVIANGRDYPDCPSMIIDPSGQVLAEETLANRVRLADLPKV